MSGATQNVDGCAVCGSAGMYLSCSEFGPEWQASGETSCGVCKLANTAISGATVICKHYRYLGDPTSCCLGNVPAAGTSCDPAYQLQSTLCTTPMTTYCGINDNVISDSKCAQWGLAQPAAYNNLMYDFCAVQSNYDNPACKAWASSNTAMNDVPVQNWCSRATNAGKPFCACVNSKLKDPKYGINPVCVDGACIAGGYITSNMRAIQCPEIVNCTQQTTINNAGVSIGNTVPIEQNCGNTAQKPAQTPGQKPVQTPVPAVKPPQKATPPAVIAKGPPGIILFLVFFFVMVIAAIILYLPDNI